MKLITPTVMLLSIFLTVPAWAELDALDNNQLQQVDGQSGADLSLVLRLNQTPTGDFDKTRCADLAFCRLAISLNNRYDNGSYIDATGMVRTSTGAAGTTADLGKKQWIVFKGIQGTINIQQLSLDGADLLYATDKVKPAIQLGFDKTKPILIRNLGFQSLSIETDTVANEGTNNTPGYLSATNYSGTNNFDANNWVTGQAREKGFIGINMNGNLAVAGTIKIFGCDASFARCQ